MSRGILPSPTSALPGSSEKVAILEARAAAGEHLFHPDDPCDESGWSFHRGACAISDLLPDTHQPPRHGSFLADDPDWLDARPGQAIQQPRRLRCPPRANDVLAADAELIDIWGLCQLAGLRHRSHPYPAMKAGKLPRPAVLGGGKAGKSYWRKADVLACLEQRRAAS